MEESHGLAGWREILGVLPYECDDSMLLVDASAGPVMVGGGRDFVLVGRQSIDDGRQREVPAHTTSSISNMTNRRTFLMNF